MTMIRLGIGVLLLVMISVSNAAPRDYRYSAYASALLSRHRRSTEGQCSVFCASGSCINPPLRCNTCPKDHTFNMDKSACLRCPANCKKCGPNPDAVDVNAPKPTICMECDVGFRLSDSDNSVCEPCAVEGNVHTCTACQTEGAGKCDAGSCYPTFAYDEATKLCPKCADFCMMCDVAGTCLSDKCMAGYRYDNTTMLCRQCADGCHTCDTNGAAKCDMDSCWPGYAYMNMRCDACPANCHNCTYKTVNDVDINSCDACHANYITNPATGQCAQCPANCVRCEFDIAANKAVCRECVPYWTVDPSTNECARCQIRQFEDVITKHCAVCNLNGPGKCDNGETDNPCEINQFGYNTDTHECEACPAYCKKCQYSVAMSSLVCFENECSDVYGYVPESGGCTRCIDHCMSCAIGNTCSPGQCTLGYSLIADTCELCSDGCKLCDAPSTCKECQTGYAFLPSAEGSDVGTCVPCPHRCDICHWDADTEETVCTVCAPKFALFGDGVSTCDDCPDNCMYCTINVNGQIYCLPDSCHAGYVYNVMDGGCIPCVADCQSCQQQSNSMGEAVCSVCDPGFAKDTAGMCLPCPPDCTTCTYNSVAGNTVCSSCNANFKVATATGTCIQCPENCVYSSCTINAGLTSCGTCVAGYTEQNGQCSRCGPNCGSCDFMDGLIKCLSGNCEAGHALDSNTGNCEPCDLGCTSCHFSNGEKICDLCADGYSDNGYGGCLMCGQNCISCSQVPGGSILCDKQGCREGSYYVDVSLATGTLPLGTCQSCNLGCQRCRNTDMCDQCADTYALNPTTPSHCGLCSNCMPGECTWTDGDPAPVCAACADGFGHNTAQACVGCPAGCLTCSPDENNIQICDSCMAGYVEMTTSGACILCPHGCSSCSVNSGSFVCTACMTGYIQQEQLCIPCGSNCDDCSFDPDSAAVGCDACAAGWAEDAAGRCTVCASGFGTLNGMCASCPDNCPSCTLANVCPLCASGYAVNEFGQCSDCVPSNCEACVSGSQTECEICMLGYTVNAAQECVPCDSPCQHCTILPPPDEGTKCDPFQCRPGRVMGANRVCIACGPGCANCMLSATSHNLPGDCISCKRGFIMDYVTKSCVACPNGCAFCKLMDNGNTECLANPCNPFATQIQPAQSWDGSTATCADSVCAANCLADKCSEADKCNADGCDTSMSNYVYFPTEKTCKLCTANCEKCATDSTCDNDGCSVGFYYKDTTDYCQTCDAACASCSGAGPTTAECICKSTHSDIGGTCTQCHASCDGCNVGADASECKACATGYDMIGGSCLECHASCDGCNVGSDASECKACATGYDMIGGSCLACDDSCDGCDVTNDATNCKACAAGYTLVGGTCTECHASCNGCATTAANCVACANGYYPTSPETSPGTCTECTGHADSTCNQCDETDHCTECVAQTGPNPAGAGCVDCPAHCTSCNLDTAKCDPHGCAGTHTWNADDGTCIAVCPAGQFFKKNAACVAPATGCMILQTMVDDTPYCPSAQYCKPGFVWNQATEACERCDDTAIANCHVDNSGDKVSRPDGCSVGFKYDTAGACAACSANCLSCESRGAGKCDDNECKNGYFLSSAGSAYTCQPCGPHCNLCHESSTAGEMMCDDCDAGYIMANSGQCQLCPTTGGCMCKAASNSAVCQSCDTGAYLDTTTNLCYDCPARCGICHYDAGVGGPVCDTCATNAHTHGAARDCYRCYQGCTSCEYNSGSGELMCGDDGCTTNYTQATSGMCFPCPTSCGMCALNSHELKANCISCLAGTMLDNVGNTCDACVTGCQAGQCASATQCMENKCQPGYARDDGTGSCHQCVNCAECIASGGATTCIGLCNKGYYKDAGGACSMCPENCDYCDNPDTCRPQGCGPRYSIDANHQCQSCGQIAGCTDCVIVDGSVHCFQCSAQYFLTEATCKPCAPNCQGCSQENKCNSGACDTRYAYNSVDKTCLPCPQNCDDCTVSGGVSVCKSGECSTGYGPSTPGVEGSCGECTPHCGSCQNMGAGKCDPCTNCFPCTGSAESYCFSEFGLSESSTCGACAQNCENCHCSGANKCDTCVAGYARDPTSATCFLCPPNCAMCQYVMLAGASQGVTQCSVCNQGFILNPNDKTCEPCPDACNSCQYNSLSESDSNEPITRCQSSECQMEHVFRQSDGQCPNCPQNCMRCSVNATDGHTMCLATGCHTSSSMPCCKYGYGLVLADLTCKECPVNCGFCHDSGDADMVCDVCEAGFTPNSDICRPCTENCKSCAKSGYNDQVCYECEDAGTEYVLINGVTCEDCIDHCQMCEAVNGVPQCAENMCDEHYAKNVNGQCQPCSTVAFTGCSMCSDVNAAGVSECTACMDGFTFNENKTACQKCDVSCPGNCADYKYACSECTSGKEFNDERTDCGFFCKQCVGDGCLNTSASYNETEVFCTGYCFSTNTTTTGSPSVYEKGCIPLCEEKCDERGRKPKTKKCTQCCQASKCNKYLAAGADAHVNINLTLMLVLVMASIGLYRPETLTTK